MTLLGVSTRIQDVKETMDVLLELSKDTTNTKAERAAYYKDYLSFATEYLTLKRLEKAA